MHICICIKLKRNYVGFDPQWTRYVGGRLSPAQAQSFDKNKCMDLKKFQMF